MKRAVLGLFLLIILLISANLSAQENIQAVYTHRFNNGTQLYNLTRFNEAAAEFRYAQEIAETLIDWSRAIYWVILSELAHSDYGSAMLDMDELEKHAPNSGFNRDMAYHRARIYFNQGFFDNSLLMFRRYIDSVTETDRESSDRRAAAYFWSGECLFAMGRFDEAESFYNWVVSRYPQSPKKEISTYRIDLIKQKKIEAELLALLQWSHEESLRTSEDYQRRLRTYEYTLNTYQRRIADLTQVRQPVQETEQIAAPAVVPAPVPAQQEPTAEDLLEKARRLNEDLEQVIRENGGYN